MNPLLVFDIETIPDVAGLRKLYELDAQVSDNDVAEMAFQMRRRKPALILSSIICKRSQRFHVCCVRAIISKYGRWAGLTTTKAASFSDFSTASTIYPANCVVERQRI